MSYKEKGPAYMTPLRGNINQKLCWIKTTLSNNSVILLSLLCSIGLKRMKSGGNGLILYQLSIIFNDSLLSLFPSYQLKL